MICLGSAGADHAVRVARTGAQMAVPFCPRMLPGFAPLDLPAQSGGNLEPGGVQRVVARFGMDVRSGHGQRDIRAEGLGILAPMFQHHRRDADGDEALESCERQFKPTAEARIEVETTNVELDFHRVYSANRGAFPPVAGAAAGRLSPERKRPREDGENEDHVSFLLGSSVRPTCRSRNAMLRRMDWKLILFLAAE